MYITSDPKEEDGKLIVEYAVVRTSADGKPVLVSSRALAELTNKKAAEIGRNLGGNVVEAKVKPEPIKDNPTSKTRSKGKRLGLIAGVVAVGLTVIIASITIWYFRLEKTC